MGRHGRETCTVVRPTVPMWSGHIESRLMSPREEGRHVWFIAGPSHRKTALSIHASRSAARIDSGETHAVGECIHHTGRDAAMRTTKFRRGRVTSGSACMQARCKGARRTRGDRPRSAWILQCTVMIITCSNNGSVVKSHLHAMQYPYRPLAADRSQAKGLLACSACSKGPA